MKINLKISLIILLGLFWTSNITKNSQQKTRCKLAITLDSTFNDDIIEVEILSAKNSKKRIIWTDFIGDSKSKAKTQKWDKLISGNYIFKIKTIFHKEQTLSFTISTDTSFHLTNKLDLKDVPFIDQNTLSEADTIAFVYRSRGCFGGSFEKSILTKNKMDSSYLLKAILHRNMENKKPLDVTKKVPADILLSLFKLQNESTKLKEAVYKSRMISVSTGTQYLYVLAGNQVYRFNDMGIPDWNLYQLFRENYIVQRKKDDK